MQTPEPTAPKSLQDRESGDLERVHNAFEHRRGHEYDSAAAEPDESLEPWPDYDVTLMPRGV